MMKKISNPLPIPFNDAFLIELTPYRDERGHFMRTFSPEDFKELGLETNIAQIASSFNLKKGTLRGMHFQIPPMAETKVVRCVRGRIFDVIIDLRRDSPTFCKWAGFELSEDRPQQLFIPKGFAHGFQTLEDNSEILYQISTPYSPDHYRGVRWNDAAFNIQWPLPVTTIAERDDNYPDFQTD